MKKGGGKLWAILSIVLGIVALIFSWVPFLGLILAIAAIVIAGIGLSKKSNKGLVIAGLVLGIIALLIALVISAITGAFIATVDGETLEGVIEDFEFIDECSGLCESAYESQIQIDTCANSCAGISYSGTEAQKEAMLNSIREIRDR